MSKLMICSGCEGFIPAGRQSCPNCAPGFSRSLRDSMKTVLTALAGSAMAVTLSACYGSPCAGADGDCFMPEVTCEDDAQDLDRDGFCGEFDCDEERADTHVYADEIQNDGIDQNCDGQDWTE